MTLLPLGVVLLVLCFAPGLQARPCATAGSGSGMIEPPTVEPEILAARDEVLEQVRFILYGKERSEVAEVQLVGDQYQLTLFSEKLASHYSVQISQEEWISSESIPAGRAAQILRERALTIAARERLRIERRELRRSRIREQQDRPSGRNSAGRTGSSSSRVEAVDMPISSLATPILTSESAKQSVGILQQFLLVSEELGQRIDHMGALGVGCVSQLSDWNRASERGSALYSRLREETYHLIEQIEFLARKVQSRSQEISRSIISIEDGEIRSRDIAEVSDLIRRRLLSIEEKLDSLEAQLGACSDGIAGLGDPIVRASTASEPSDIAARPEPATARRTAAVTQTVADLSQIPSQASPTGATLTSRRAAPELSRSTPRRPKSKEEIEPDGQSGSSDRGVVGEDQPSDDLEDANRSDSTRSDSTKDAGMTRTLLLGGILGAIFAWAVAQLVKHLGFGTPRP
ncbi:MAG: hypothetical protein OSB09_00530 [Planctomycetota bacterium]|nr:hypothetical protein [Planctomycetota bacterium]